MEAVTTYSVVISSRFAFPSRGAVNDIYNIIIEFLCILAGYLRFRVDWHGCFGMADHGNENL